MRKCLSLIGQTYGMLTVTEHAEPTASGQHRWLCRCTCGNETIVLGSNLKRGTTVSCGCKKQKDLTGQHIGRLTVLERSDQYASRGKRKMRLWKCQCDCGTITYKTTDTLTNSDISMCKECASSYATTKAREKAGFKAGTQITKIKSKSESSDNASGIRGVYRESKTGKYRARIRFRGKLYDLGSYACLEDAINARKQGEKELFDTFLASFQNAAESPKKADNA